jgi:tRNA 2-thiouridine synthesizing protein B
MGNLYLIDRPFGENGLALARNDPNAAIVLIQDGVYFDVGDFTRNGNAVYAIRQDVALRGLESRLPASVKRIDYGELVDLVLQHKVINFA